MIELKITGNTVQEFYADACNTLMLVARGGQAMQSAPPVADPQVQADPPAGDPPRPDDKVVVHHEEPQIEDPAPIAAATVADPPAAKRRPGRPAKSLEQRALEGEVPAAPEPPVKLTMTDHIRPRVMDIHTANRERAKKEGVADADGMKQSVAYIMKLLHEFGVQKATDVPEDRFAEFMERSQAYLDGSVT